MAQIKRPHRGDPHRHKPKKVSKRAFEKVYWPYIPLVAALVLVIGFSTPSGALSTAFKARPGNVLAYSTSMSINGLLQDTNVQRANNDVRALTLNSKLIAAAQAKADDMAKRNYWSHYTPDGDPPWIFVTEQGYSYQKLGENLAAGFSDEQSTINGWMASPPHRENLLDSAFTEVGFGYANNANYTSAGGGPMTIVVAFYGEPTVTIQPVSPVTSTTPKTAESAIPATKPKPATAAKTNVVKKPASKPKTSDPQPVTTATPKAAVKDSNLPIRQTGAQLALAKEPAAGVATGLALALVVVAGAIWISRHLLRLRRMLVHGEKYVLHHPLFDVGILTLGFIAYLLTQTVGIIK